MRSVHEACGVRRGPSADPILEPPAGADDSLSLRVVGEIRYASGGVGVVVADEHGREHVVRGVAPATASLSSPEPDEKPLAELLEPWQRYMKRHEGAGDRHLQKSATAVQAMLAFTGWRYASEIEPGPVLDWVAAMMDEGAARKTAANRLSAVRQFGRWLDITRKAPANPFASLRQPRVTKTDMGKGSRALTLEQIREFIAVAERMEAEGPRKRPWLRNFGPNRSTLYTLMAHSMIRHGEAMSQRWDDIDLDRGRMTLTCDKARRRDWIPLHPEAIAALRELRSWQDANLCPVWGRAFFRVSHHTVAKDMDRAGIPRLISGDKRGAWHCFRKSGVTSRLAAGQDAAIVQRLARHADIRMTLEVYNQIQGGAIEAAAHDYPALNGAARRGCGSDRDRRGTMKHDGRQD